MIQSIYLALFSVLITIIGILIASAGFYLHYEYYKSTLSLIIILMGSFYVLCGILGFGLKKIFCGLSNVVHGLFLTVLLVLEGALVVVSFAYVHHLYSFIDDLDRKYQARGNAARIAKDYIANHITYVRVGATILTALTLIAVLCVVTRGAKA